MHESKGHHIGEAPSLHLFHTTVGQCMGTTLQPLLAVHGCSLVLRSLPPPMWPENEASMILLVALCYMEPLQSSEWSRLQTYDSVVHDGMVLASSPATFLLPHAQEQG